MSPFLAELSGGLFDRAGSVSSSYFSSHQAEHTPAEPIVKKRREKRLDIKDFKVGMKVSHPFFGEGIVSKLSGSRSLDIQFDRHGLKTLHLDYAKLTIMSG